MSTYSIGVDLGGTNLRIAAFSSRWKPLQSVRLPTRVHAGAEAVVSDMCRAIRSVMETCADVGELEGIGIGSPGPLELPEGVLHNPPNLPGWNGFRLKQAVEEALGNTVFLECDANAAALAEWVEGAGKSAQADSLCMLTLGTGVGNGIILDRKIWHGMAGMAGEAGHIPLPGSKLACSCGGEGCLELFASATAVRRITRERAASGKALRLRQLEADNPNFDARDVAALADAGEENALRIFQELGEGLGTSLAGLINILNLQLYVIGGGLASAWHLFAPEMIRTMRRLSYVYRLTEPTSPGAFEKGKTAVVPAQLGPDAGLLGAAMLPYAQQFTHSDDAAWKASQNTA